MRGEHRSDRDALLLPARERPQRARAQLRDPEQVEGLLDAFAHHLGRQAELLHRVGELFLDRVGDEPREWVLSDIADGLGHVAWLVLARVEAADDNTAREMAAGEVGHETVDRAEQAGLAGSGRPDHKTELALVDREVDVAQHGAVAAGVCERVDVEADHDAATVIRAPAGSRRGARRRQAARSRREARRPGPRAAGPRAGSATAAVGARG